MANLTAALHCSEHYSTLDEDLYSRLGPMRFGILDHAIKTGIGTWYCIDRYRYPKNAAQLQSLHKIVQGFSYETFIDQADRTFHIPTGSRSEGANIIVVNPSLTKVTVVKGDFKLEDLGIHICDLTVNEIDGKQYVDHKKVFKRLKAITRPFRIYGIFDDIKVLRIKRNAQYPNVLDGASLISRRLVNACIDNMAYPVQNGVLARMRNWAHDQIAFNGVIIGNLVDVEVGPLAKMMKGQFFVADLPEGIDVVTSDDNLKDEIYSDGTPFAFCGIEPQGPKAAREDQQTVSNHWQLCRPQDVVGRLMADGKKHLDKVYSGQFRYHISELAGTIRSDKEDRYVTHETFTAMMKWRLDSFLLHKGNYLWSPWLTSRLTEMWLDGLGLGRAGFQNSWQKTLKIPIPNAIRAQIVSEEIYRMWCKANGLVPKPIPVTKTGHPYMLWSDEMRCAVVSNHDWENVIMASHGGCDADDFFVLRKVKITGTTVDPEDNDRIIAHRNPNARGEYTVWRYDADDNWPQDKDDKGNDVVVEVNMDQMPMQILDALSSGITRYVPLPSAVKPKGTAVKTIPYDASVAMSKVTDYMSIDGGYGQYEIALRAHMTTDPFYMIAETINSEDAVDAFAQASDVDDQKFILDRAAELVTKLVVKGMHVDPYIAGRLGSNKVPAAANGPIAALKSETITAANLYRELSAQYWFERSKMPWWLEALGQNEYLRPAKQLLTFMRRQMYLMSGTAPGADGLDLIKTATGNTDETVTEFIASIDDEFKRHKFVLAFWYACLTTPTSAGTISDQPVFATGAFDHLLEALKFFGICAEPFVSAEGRIEHYDLCKIIDPETWEVTCRGCGKQAQVQIAGLKTFWRHNMFCKSCR